MKKLFFLTCMMTASLFYTNDALAQSAKTVPNTKAVSDFQKFKTEVYYTSTLTTQLQNMKGTNISLYENYVAEEQTIVRLYRRFVQRNDQSVKSVIQGFESKYGLTILK